MREQHTGETETCMVNLEKAVWRQSCNVYMKTRKKSISVLFVSGSNVDYQFVCLLAELVDHSCPQSEKSVWDGMIATCWSHEHE